MKSQCPRIELTHGQAVWVLQHLFDGNAASGKAFDSYIKYLRRAGIPFDADELGVGAGINVVYNFEHLMELATALFLKSQAILPKDVVQILANLRDELRPIYKLAWTERDTGLGTPIWIRPGNSETFRLKGKGFSLCFRSHQMLIGLLRSRHGSWTVPGDVRELLDLGK